MKSALFATISAALVAMTSAAAAQDVTLQFWDNQQTESGLSDVQQAAVDRFMEENPGIKIEVTTIPYPEYQQRLVTAVQGGNAPDIATLDQIWVGAFAAAGVDPASIGTFEGLRAAAESLTGDGKFGVGLFGHNGEDTVVVANSFIFSNGGEVLAEDGSCALNQPPAVEAMAYLQDLAQFAPEGILNASSGDMRELFLMARSRSNSGPRWSSRRCKRARSIGNS